VRALVPDSLLPAARRAKLVVNKYRALVTSALPGRQRPEPRRRAFVVGCGRSGTTLLGRLLAAHPNATYIEEPYHLWAAVDRRSDVTGLHFVKGPYRYFLDAPDVSSAARKRFDRLARYGRAPDRVWIEKMPHNVARIGWIEGLTDDARYVNIVRNGRAVAASIGRIATLSTFKIAGKSAYNQWWGHRQRRWTALAAEGAEMGYFPDEVGDLDTHEQRGAYEWLISVSEAQRWAPRLGGRLTTITYTALTGSPAQALHRVGGHLGLGAPLAWPEDVISSVRSEPPVSGAPLRLPPQMRIYFNSCQDRFGFPGRADPL
jgi:hypothetical protein